MSQRYDEPEYIDDDEYFDPDDAGGSGRRGARVLGGSGSRRDRRDNPAQSAAPKPAWGKKRDRKARPSADIPAGRSAEKARNPAPSAASSEERRARLAGKLISNKKQPAEKPLATGAPHKAAGPTGKGRLSGLRARFSRKEGDRASKGDSSGTRLATVAGGISGRVKGLRGRLGSDATSSSAKTGQRRAEAAGVGRSRGGSERAKSEAPPKARPSKAPIIETDNWLDLDRKLDLIGVALVFGAIVLTISALSPEQAAIGALHALIGQLLGWGAVAVPIAMFAAGLWLIVRHFGERAPTIDPTRLSGVALLFFAVLVLFQFLDSLSYGELLASTNECAATSSPACVDALVQRSYLGGRGGGMLGGWFYSALINNLTELGGFVIVFMALTIGAMMITRSSMAELAVVAISLGRGARTRASQYAAKRRAAQLEVGGLAPTGADAKLRVSKPPAAQLAGASRHQNALPPPSSATMPIPSRLRGLFGFRRRWQEEAVPLESEARTTAAQKPGMMGRIFSRRGQSESPAIKDARVNQPTQAGANKSGALERFLNLGDDIPAAAQAARATPAPNLTPQTQTKRAPQIRRPVASADPLIQPPPAPIRSDEVAAKPEPQPGKIAAPDKAPPARHAPSKADAPIDDILEAAAAIKRSDAPAPVAPVPADNAGPDADVADHEGASARQSAEAPKQKTASEQPRLRTEWELPARLDFLDSISAGELDQEPLLRQAQIIEDTLASFGAPGRVVEINSGPVITQYGVEPAYVTARNDKKNRVKVSAIAKLDKDLQLALGARSIRVEAPVPGKGYVGIEVPNPDAALVSLRDVMESRTYQDIDSPLAIALGMSVDGAPISADLTQMPHLLIAGTTGSGKSKCINAIIISILSTSSPEQVKFIMIDPKRVELTGYNGLPHLVAPVVVELERTVGALRWVTTEMDNRYRKFSAAGARNIIDYNRILDPDLAPIPYIVVIIDELADLMMMAPDDTERAITRIAALARATGIHLVIATQRPSVDVVTGLIKANCPARIAFAVASSIDSKVILDHTGADRLLGKGDMLYLSGESPAPLRMQGVFVSDEEILRVSRFWKLQGAGVTGVQPITIPAVATAKSGRASRGAGNSAKFQTQDGAQTAFWDMSPTHDPSDGGAYDPQEDELYQTAVDMVRRLEKASISLLQRRLRIGYTRAARLVDMMEERGVVGPPKEGSSKPRDVLPPKPAS